MALLEWSRAAELSCDRAAALVTRDPLAVCRTLMSLTAGVKPTTSTSTPTSAGRRRTARAARASTGPALWLELGVTHALPVKRVHEVMEWVRGGDFDRIVGGEYPQRGDPVDVREQADEAVEFYRERFAAAFRDVGDNGGRALAGGWLRRRAATSRRLRRELRLVCDVRPAARLDAPALPRQRTPRSRRQLAHSPPREDGV